MFSCGPYFHAFTAIPRRQPLDLSYGQAQPVGRTPWLELAVHHILNDLESVQLAHRHRYPFCRSHLGLQHREHGGRIAYAARKRTFLSSQKRTLLKSRNIRAVDNCDYVKSQSNLGGHPFTRPHDSTNARAIGHLPMRKPPIRAAPFAGGTNAERPQQTRTPQKLRSTKARSNRTARHVPPRKRARSSTHT